MESNLVEDGKVISSAGITMLIEYAEIFNQLITLMISICTLIYVANRAWKAIKDNQNTRHNKKRKKKKVQAKIEKL